MSDNKDGVGRREALWWLLSAPLHLRLLSSTASAHPLTSWSQAGAGALPNAPAANSPIARNLHPRTFVTPDILATLRTQIAQDNAFRSRWQTAVSQFESSGGTWTSGEKGDPYATAVGAFFACVRRPDNDLGLRWRSSWKSYRDRIVATAATWPHDGTNPPVGIALALVYDFLHADLTAQERSDLAAWITVGADKFEYAPDDKNQWDAHASDDHAAKLLSSLVLDDAAKRFAKASQETRDWADARSWLGYATGVGYEWKDSHPTTPGLCACIFSLKNAGGLSEAETTDRMGTHLRDAWQHIRQFVIPHPAQTWFNDRVNMTQPEAYYHRQLNVGAHMLWALALLPGKVKLSGASRYSDQPTLANGEAAYFGYLQHVLTSSHPSSPDRTLRNVVDLGGVGTFSPSPSKPGVCGLFVLPAWLVLNAQERAPMDPVAAGIPKVRRWWPGTLEWTTVLSDFSHTSATLITYHHRKWWLNAYEEGCRQNGSWHVHRAGPLLGQRGSASHGPISRKATWAANGTVNFIDPAAYPEFTFPDMAREDSGGVRAAGSGLTTKAEILSKAAVTDYGDVTSWYADARVVAISSNLVRSYNSTVVQVGRLPANAPKISAFTREFVCIQRGADGSDHERIFTYDRIQLVDTRYEPRYNLCPATDPKIDGVETPHQPWAPPNGDWTAVGPTRWDYRDATRMLYDNTKEPKAGKSGNGKVCVTWLEPAPARVTKRGGTNARSEKIPQATGAPAIGPWNGWADLDGEWNKVASTELRAYSGLYTVEVIPANVTADTRFLIACDVMAANANPDAATVLPCDAGSAAARCGASAVVFARAAGGHRSGQVTIPNGVSLVVLANLPPGQTRTLAAADGLTITTAERAASAGETTEGGSNSYGRLVVGVSGSGTLTFS